MLRFVLAATAAALMLAGSAVAAVKPFPAQFQARDIKTGDGLFLHVRTGGSGPVVVMLHGFGDSGDMWEPLASVMVKDHTVIVPDLRGFGLSAHPQQGFTKKSEAEEIAQVLKGLGVTKFDLVTHDIGNMVGYALVAEHPDQVRRWVAMDAPLPGVGHWDDQLKNPKTWHFNFPRPGRRAPGRRARADLPGPVLQRAVGQSGRDRRGDPPALRGALLQAAGHARRA
jgi:pimeloyl-ACP methyl ester carboxylesterase